MSANQPSRRLDTTMKTVFARLSGPQLILCVQIFAYFFLCGDLPRNCTTNLSKHISDVYNRISHWNNISIGLNLTLE